MQFRRVRVKSQLNPEQFRATYFVSNNGHYRIHKSLNSTKWLAYVRTNLQTENFTLVGPPVDTKKEAISLCEEHSLALPW